jgi:hypothetical protein
VMLFCREIEGNLRGSLGEEQDVVLVSGGSRGEWGEGAGQFRFPEREEGERFGEDETDRWGPCVRERRENRGGTGSGVRVGRSGWAGLG